MYTILRNMLTAFAVAFWFISTIVILILPDLIDVSRFWFLLSLPLAAAWAAFWATAAYEYDNRDRRVR